MANANPIRPNIDKADILLKGVEAILKESSSWLRANVGCFLSFSSLDMTPNHVSISAPYRGCVAWDQSALALWEKENPKPKPDKATNHAALRVWQQEKSNVIRSEIGRVSQQIADLASAQDFSYQTQGDQVFLLPRKKKTRRGYRRR